MKTLREFLLIESFLNLFTADQKEPYADAVYAMIQTAYAKIGGIVGSGFSSPQDMISKIPFWKLVRKDGKIVAVALYKDKDGRKRVAVATDGTEAGKEALKSIYVADFDRAYFEVSGPSLSLIVKTVGIDFVLKYAITVDKVKNILKDDEIVSPDPNDIAYRRFTQLDSYMYGRKIGGEVHTKVMLGTPGNKIVVSS